MSIPSPITWFGGKSRLAPKIIQHFPKHKCYCEPFGGGASVLLAKEPSPIEVFNDLDGELVNFFRVLRDPRLSARLRRSLEHTPYARVEFLLAQQPTDDPVEAARRFMVRQRQSFAGKGGEWSFSVAKSQRGVSSAVMRWRAGIERLPAVHERLRGVQIEHDDWAKVMHRYDGPETLHFLDPPYIRSLRVEGGYRYELSESDHRELVARLLTVKGMVILCAYNHVKIHGPLERAGWKKVDYDVAAQSSDHRARRLETLWLSPSSLLSSYQGNRKLFLSPRERMREGSYQLHRMRVASTTGKILGAIERLRRSEQKPTMARVARTIKCSPEHLSRKYRHLFA
ncbi:MAG: DNA adenine methylase [Candidatus Acidiferrales bacterium]